MFLKYDKIQNCSVINISFQADRKKYFLESFTVIQRALSCEPPEGSFGAHKWSVLMKSPSDFYTDHFYLVFINILYERLLNEFEMLSYIEKYFNKYVQDGDYP